MSFGKADLMKSIKYSGKKKITLDEIIEEYRIEDYSSLVKFIIYNIEKGNINPIKGSRTNGKNPALYNSYWIIVEEDNSELINNILYKLNPLLKVDYYINNIEKYKEDEEYIVKLSRYLDANKHLLDESVSFNERSFEIWGMEKFLKKSGSRILKNLGLSIEDLNVYETMEPLSYYSHHKRTPQNVLIIENMDTFYSMRRHLINGNDSILGVQIGSLIYGKGKGIIKSFKDFKLGVEPYLSDDCNSIYYFGDLDYEGIVIYESLYEVFKDKISIKPFTVAYIAMLEKSREFDLPETKKGQNKNIGKQFLMAFNEEDRIEMIEILSKNKYIPQEILNSIDF